MGGAPPFKAFTPLLSFSQRNNQIDQGAHGRTGSSLDQMFSFLVGYNGAGDIKVYPGSVSDKLGKKLGCRDGSGQFTAGILEVSYLALILLFVFLIHRHLPDAFSDRKS